LERCINKTIQTALSSIKTRPTDPLSILLADLEILRLKHLVQAQLRWEKERPPFQIAATERAYSIRLSGIDFKVRVDRLDQVADKKWIIDYKSSLPDSRPWSEDRPKEPQLLVYALLDEQINTITFLQLKTGAIKCSGYSETEQEIQGIIALKKDETWNEKKAQWQQQLHALAAEYQQGYCAPEPIDTALCTYCDFQNLCRLEH
jgi:ATP-dependent helicase/nuclease subunit B